MKFLLLALWLFGGWVLAVTSSRFVANLDMGRNNHIPSLGAGLGSRSVGE